MGCYIDGNNEDMGPPQTVNGKFSAVSLSDKTKDGVSIDACANHCKKEGFMFFGMMFGGACRCSNSYGSKGEDPNGCTMDCLQGTDYTQFSFFFLIFKIPSVTQLTIYLRIFV